MKPPAHCSPQCVAWFAMTAKAQRTSLHLHRTYPYHGLKAELKTRFRIRLSMLRYPSF